MISTYLSNWQLAQAANLLLQGGVIAYPTETVWGLGCLPWHENAVQRVINIKRRSPQKGLILLASRLEHISPWVIPLSEEQEKRLIATYVRPTTWIIPANDQMPHWITGGRATVAIRLTTHPLAKALCDKVGLLVSTSANASGKLASSSRYSCIQQFNSQVDRVLPGVCGQENVSPAKSRSSKIVDLINGKILRS